MTVRTKIRHWREDRRCRRYFGPGYVVPRGQALKRKDYPELYAALAAKRQKP